MLKKEAKEAEKNPILPTKQIEDEAAAAEQRIYELAQKTSTVLSQMVDPNTISLGDLKRRETELRSLKKAIEGIGVPKELDAEYQRLSAELIKCGAEIQNFNKQVKLGDNAQKTNTTLSDLILTLRDLNAELNDLKSSGQDTADVEQKIADTTDQINARLQFDSSTQSARELNQYLNEVNGALKTMSTIDMPFEGMDNLFDKMTIDYEVAGRIAKKFKSDLSTALDIRDVKNGANASFQSVIDTIDNVEQKMRMTTGKANLSDLLQRLAELEKARNTLKDFGFPVAMERQLVTITQLISQTKQEIKDYQKDAKEAEKAGVSFGERFSSAMNGTNNAVKFVGNELKRLSYSIEVIKKGFNALESPIRAIQSGIHALSRYSSKTKSSFDRMAKSMRSNFKHMITSVTKYVLGFRSLFFLVRRLRKYIGEGIKNLAQFEGGNNAVNESITDMLTSLLYLKNAWAAAFSPVIQFVRPILVSLIDSLAEVGNAVARFLSFLFNQEIAFNAVRVDAQDYADSLDSAAGSAGSAADKTKKLTDRLAAFDDLDVLGKDNDPDGTGSGGGGGGADSYIPDPNEMFEIVDPEGSGLVGKLIDAWKAADFSEIGTILRDKIVNALDSIEWDYIQKQGYKVGKSFATFLNGIFGETTIWSEVAETLAQGINTAMWSAYGFIYNDETDWGGGFATFVSTLYEKTDWQDIQDILRMFINKFSTNVGSFFKDMSGEDIGADLSGGFIRFLEEGNYFSIDRDQLEEDFKQIGEFFGSFLNGLFGDPEAFQSAGKLIADVLDDITLSVQAFLDETKDLDFGGNLAEGINTFLEENDLGAIATNINEAVSQLDENINSFLETLDNEQLAQSIADFIHNLDIPQMLADAGKTTIHLVCDFIDISSDVILDLSDRISEDMVISVTEPIETGITYTDDKGNEQHLNIQTTIDWTDNPIEALLDAILLKIGEFWVTDIAGLDTLDEIDEVMSLWNEWFGKYFNKEKHDADAGISGDPAHSAGGGRAGESVHGPGGNSNYGSHHYDMKEWWDDFFNLDIDEFFAKYYPSAADKAHEALKQIDDDIVWLTDDVQNAGLVGEEVGYSGGKAADHVKGKSRSMRVSVEEDNTALEEETPTTWDNIKSAIELTMSALANNLGLDWDEIKGTAYQKWVELKLNVTTKAQEVKDTVEEKINTLKDTLAQLWQDIKGKAYEKFVEMKTNIITVFNQLKEKIKGPINGFIDTIEDMINKVIDGINWLADELNALPDVQFSWMGQNYELGFNIPTLSPITIPHLAQGAVIPPNKAFMAVLGDQSHGTNIEAPLDTIKQAVAEVIANNNNQEVIDLLQQLIRVVESKNLTIGDKEIGKANARFTKQHNNIRGTSF